MITVTFGWTVAFYYANLYQCLPLWINWTGFGYTVENCINPTTLDLAQAWPDVLIDGK